MKINYTFVIKFYYLTIRYNFSYFIESPYNIITKHCSRNQCFINNHDRTFTNIIDTPGRLIINLYAVHTNYQKQYKRAVLKTYNSTL